MSEPRHVSGALDRYLDALYARCARGCDYRYSTLDQYRHAHYGGSAGPPPPTQHYGGSA